MSDKPQQPKQAVQPTIDELTQHVDKLARELVRHNNAHSFLGGCIDQQCALPTLRLSATDGPEPPEGFLTLDMTQLPQEAGEIILGILFEHTERMAAELWKQLASRSVAACKSVEQHMQRKAEYMKKMQEAQERGEPFDEGPTVLPFSGPTQPGPSNGGPSPQA